MAAGSGNGTRPLRLLFLNYEYPPLGGGAANATYHLLREFSAFRDIEVDLIASSPGARRVERPWNNVTVHLLDIGKRGSIHYQSYRELLVYAWKAFWYAGKLQRRSSYDVTLAFFGIPCGVIARLLRVPYVVSLRGSDVPGYSDRLELLDRLVFRRLSRYVWKGARRVVALSEDLAGLARRTCATVPIDVIYNGVDTTEFTPPRSGAGATAAQETLRVGFVGRLIPRKGLQYAIPALRLCRDQGVEVRLSVAGDGPLRDELAATARREGVADLVEFRGIVPHGELPAFYRSVDVVAIPSLSEALGNVTHEALAAGRPIVTTRTGAAEIADGASIVVETASSEAIARALMQLAAAPELRRQLSENARAIAESMSWKEAAGRYGKLLRDAVVPTRRSL